MNDPQIRQLLTKQFLGKYKNPDFSLVLEEMGILHGSSIVDICVISKIYNHAFEIKSADDSLTRLPSQLKDYIQVFDYITIITQPSHLNALLPLLPPFIGIILTYDNNHLEHYRMATANTNVKMKKLVHLLWKKEIYDFLRTKGHKGISSFSYAKLRKLLESYNDKEIRELVFNTLKERKNWKNPLVL